MAFGVAFATLAGGVFLIYTGKVVGYALSGISVIGLGISAIRSIVAMFKRPEAEKEDE